MEDKNSDHAKIMKFCYPYAACKDFQMSTLHMGICVQYTRLKYRNNNNLSPGTF